MGVVAAAYPSPAERFIYLLNPTGEDATLAPRHWEGFLDCVLDEHPGLAFLAELPEFRSRYRDTVVARVFYSVNRCVVWLARKLLWVSQSNDGMSGSTCGWAGQACVGAGVLGGLRLRLRG